MAWLNRSWHGHTQAAMEALEEAQERYAQARARREKFLMEAQRNFQKMAERHEAEMDALVSQEAEVADMLEARAMEVKQVSSRGVSSFLDRVVT